MIVLPFHRQGDLSAAVREVRSCLAEAGVVLLPTETFYGLGCDPWSEKAVHKVLHLKDRPKNIPLPLLAADWAQVDRLTVIPGIWRHRLESRWPGPITAVLPLRESLPLSMADTVAVRIPDHRLLRRMLSETGPLTGTSANRHGDPPARDVAAALKSMVGDPDLVLDGGSVAGGQPSTLVDLTGVEARILRQGTEVWDESGRAGT